MSRGFATLQLLVDRWIVQSPAAGIDTDTALRAVGPQGSASYLDDCESCAEGQTSLCRQDDAACRDLVAAPLKYEPYNVRALSSE
eukprot:SAG11_NODE_9761_length_882_cov_1.929757_2_plen_85_part_00